MIAEVVVRSSSVDRPPTGSPVIVQIRDTALADVEAPLLAQATGAVGAGDAELATVAIHLSEEALGPHSRPTVFVHVDVDRDGAISAGDEITTASTALPRRTAGSARVEATVRRI